MNGLVWMMILLFQLCHSLWLSLELLWLSKPPNLLLVCPYYLECTKICQWIQVEEYCLAPSFRLIGSQTLRQQLLKYANV